MIRHVWTILCNQVIIDKETNLVSYINALEGVNVVELPSTLPTFTISTLWMTDDLSAILNHRIRIISPSGKALAERKLDSLPFNKPRYRINIQVAGVRVEEEGDYHVMVEFKSGRAWKEAAQIPIPVTRIAEIDG